MLQIAFSKSWIAGEKISFDFFRKQKYHYFDDIIIISEIICFLLFHFSYLDVWFIVGDRCQVIHCDHIRRPESANQKWSRLIWSLLKKQMILSLPKIWSRLFRRNKSPQSLFIANAGLIFLLLVGKEFKHWRNWISIL